MVAIAKMECHEPLKRGETISLAPHIFSRTISANIKQRKILCSIINDQFSITNHQLSIINYECLLDNSIWMEDSRSTLASDWWASGSYLHNIEHTAYHHIINWLELALIIISSHTYIYSKWPPIMTTHPQEVSLVVKKCFLG